MDSETTTTTKKTSDSSKKERWNGPNYKWLTAFIAAMFMIFAFLTVTSAVAINNQVNETKDQLQCLTYELNAHRIEDQKDAEQNAKEHGFVREPDTEPSLTLPKKLRESCETILPGSTERGEPR
jgi:hypothetical protein